MCRVVETNAVASPSRCAALPLVMAVPLALRRGRCRHFLPTSPMVPVPLLLSSAGIEFGGAFVPLFVSLRRKAAAGNGVRIPPQTYGAAVDPASTQTAPSKCQEPFVFVFPRQRHRHSSTGAEYMGTTGNALRGYSMALSTAIRAQDAAKCAISCIICFPPSRVVASFR